MQLIGGRLSVRARGVPLVNVLDEVERRTGVSFVGAAGLRAPISTDITALPLPLALGEILRNVNHVLLWTSDPEQSRRVRRVVVLGSDAPAADADGRPGHVTGPKGRKAAITDTDTSELVRFASDSDSSTRRWALECLSGSTDQNATDTFREALSDPDPQVREEALSAIAYADGADLRDVEEILAHEKVGAVRIAAIRLLGEIKEEGRTELFMRLLEDRDPAVRVAVVEAAAREEGPTANDILMRAAQDAEPSVRMAALSTAVYYAPGEGIRPVLERALQDNEAGVRSLAEELIDSLQDMDEIGEGG